jgi:hypothetical protein
MTDQEHGFLLGFFCEQGNFGGDGKQGHIILRMGETKYRLLLRLCRLLPGSRIHGPYVNGSRRYWQWSLRGEGLEQLVTNGTLEGLQDFDPSAYERYAKMVSRYFGSAKSRRMTSSSGGSSTESV